MALLEDRAAGARSQAPDKQDGNDAGGEGRDPGHPLALTNENGQTLYLKSMTEQLTGWDDPEARLRQALGTLRH